VFASRNTIIGYLDSTKIQFRTASDFWSNILDVFHWLSCSQISTITLAFTIHHFLMKNHVASLVVCWFCCRCVDSRGTETVRPQIVLEKHDLNLLSLKAACI